MGCQQADEFERVKGVIAADVQLSALFRQAADLLLINSTFVRGNAATVQTPERVAKTAHENSDVLEGKHCVLADDSMQEFILDTLQGLNETVVLLKINLDHAAESQISKQEISQSLQEIIRQTRYDIAMAP